MIRPLRKHEREAWAEEIPIGDPGRRISIALDRENQPSADAREHVVRYRAAAAMLRAFARQERIKGAPA